jgi:hypothetical protein
LQLGAFAGQERRMNKDQRRREFLAKAAEAEEQAAKAKESDIRESWLRIAASYRELANRN